MSHCSARSIVRAGVVIAVAAAVSAAKAQDAVTLRPGNRIDFGDVTVDGSERRLVLLDSTSPVSVLSAGAPLGSPFRADLARQAGEVVLDVQFSPRAAGRVSDTVTIRLQGGATVTLAVEGTGVGTTSSAPRFTSIPLSAAVVGREYAYGTHVSANPADGAVSYALEPGAPAGMTVSPSGTIRWTPAAGQEGLHDVTVRATNAAGTGRQTFTVVAMRVSLAVAAAELATAPADSDDYQVTIDVMVSPPRLVSLGQRAAQARMRVEQLLAPGTTHVSATGAATVRTTSAGTVLSWELPLGVTQVAHTVRLPSAPAGTPSRPLTTATHARLGIGAAADTLDVASDLLRTLPAQDPQGLAAAGDSVYVTDGAATVSELHRATGAVQSTTPIGLDTSSDVEVGLEPGRVAVVQDSTGSARVVGEYVRGAAGLVRQTRTDAVLGNLKGFAVDSASGERWFVGTQTVAPFAERLVRIDRYFGDHVAAPAGVVDVVGDGAVTWAVAPTALWRIADGVPVSFALTATGMSSLSGIAVAGDRLLLVDTNTGFRRLFEVAKPQPGDGLTVLRSTPLGFYSPGASFTGLDLDPARDEVLLVTQEGAPKAYRLGARFRDHLALAGNTPVGVAEGSDGTWVLDADRTVRRLDALGTSWVATNVVAPTGIGVRGDEVWIVDGGSSARQRYAYTYTRAGALLRRTSLQHLPGLPHGIEGAGADLLITSDGAAALASPDDRVIRVGAQFGAHVAAPGDDTTGLAPGAAPGELWAVTRGPTAGLFRWTTQAASWTRVANVTTEPRGVAYDARRGLVWVVDSSTRTIAKYAPDGRLLGSAPISSTFGVAVEGLEVDPQTSEFYLVNGGSSTIYRIGAGWGDAHHIPVYSVGDGVTTGVGVAQDGGTRWVLDFTTKYVRRVNNDGSPVAGHTPFRVVDPNGTLPPVTAVTVVGDELCFVAQGSPARVIRYAREPNAQGQHTRIGQLTLGANIPAAQGLAHLDGTYYVLEDAGATHRLYAFDAVTGASTRVLDITSVGGTNVADLSLTPDRLNLAILAADGTSLARVFEVDRFTGARLATISLTPYGFTANGLGLGGLTTDGVRYHVLDEAATDRVYAVDRAGLSWTPIASPTSAPTSVSLGPEGALFVGTQTAVLRVGGASSFLVSDFGCGPAQGMAWDGTNFQVVARLVNSTSDSVANSDARVYEMAPTGLPHTRYGLEGVARSPRGAALGPGGNLFVVDAASPPSVHEFTTSPTFALVRSFPTGAYGALGPTGLSSNGTTLRIVDDPPAGTPDTVSRLLTMDPGGLSIVTTSLPVGPTYTDIAASAKGTAVVVDATGTARELGRDGAVVGTEDLRKLGMFSPTGAGVDGAELRFVDGGRIYRTSPDMVVLQEFDLAAYGMAGVTGLSFDDEAGRLFLSGPRQIWEACVEGATLNVWPVVDLGMFTHGGQPLGDASDVAVNRAAREVYVASAARDLVYVFSLAQHRAPNPARVLLLSQGDGAAFRASLAARGHDVVAADLVAGELAARLDGTFTQVWIVGADPAGGSALSEADLSALQGWTTTSDRGHVVLDALAGRDQDPCHGIRYGQDLASVLELNGGGIVLTAGPEGAGGQGVASVNQVLDRLGLGRFSGAYVTAPATFRGRGDMVTLTWLTRWFTRDQAHANLPEGLQPGGRELYASLEGTYTSGAPSLVDGRVVLLSSTIRSASGVADVVGPGVSEPVNRVPPTLTIARPSEGQLFAARAVTIDLTYSDDLGVDVASLRVLANGADVTSSFTAGAASASGTVTLPADGPVALQATIRDIHGNPATASVGFTVDATGPVIVVSDATAEQASAAGTAVTLAPTVTDAVDPAPTWSSDAPAVYPKGATVVTVTARDAAGNTTTRAVTVTIVDTTPPAIGPIVAPAPFEQTGPAGAAVTLPALDVSDICDAGAQLSVVFTTDAGQLSSGDVLNLGRHTVTATVTDLSGNAATAQFDLVVQDTTAPIVQATDLTLEASDASGATVPAYVVTATDACDVAVALTFDRAPGTFPVGTTTVQGTAEDDTGNQQPFSFTVTVVDTTPPALTLPGPVTAEQADRDGTPVDFVRPTATDRGQPVAVTLSHEPGTNFPLGTTTVTATATDAAGLTTTGAFTVTVVDTTAPSIAVPPGGIVVEATGPEGALVTFSLPTATDICDAEPTVTCSASPGVFALGSHQVTCTATDDAGNSADATFTITVRDTTGPAIAQGPVQAEQASAAGTVVTFAPTAVDLVDGAVPAAQITCAPASGSAFPLGTTDVVVTAVDSRGNASTHTFQVVVVDTTPPTLTAPADVTAEATGPTGAAVTFPAVSTSDVCDADVTLEFTTAGGAPVASGDTFPLGVTTLRVVARDDSGNTSAASFTVTVQDTTPPILTLPADVTVEQVDWRGTVVSYPAAAAVDAVDPAPAIEYSIASGASFPLGATVVTVIATDARGNATSGTFTVLVDDTVAPVVAQAPDLTVSAVDARGAVVTFATPAATDACDANPVVVCAPASGSLFPLGTTTVTCTARDSKNVSAPVTFTVTVVDTTPPVFTATPADLTVEQDGLGGATVTFGLPAATDAVSAPTVTSQPASGTVFQLGGPWTVTCTATDAAGNTASVSFTVTVVDTTAPALTVPANVGAEATSAAGAVVTFAPTATDVCDAAVAIECAPPSGSTFPLGATTVAVTARDASGNVTTGAFTVTVADTTPPTITSVPGPITAEQGHGNGIEVTFAAPTATDTVDPAPAVTCTPASGSTFPLGTTTVQVVARDAAGNVATAEFTVTVVDTTPPVVGRPAQAHLVLEQTSHAGALVPYAPSAQDACDAAPSVTCSHELATPVPLGGPVTVTVSAVDFSGNAASIEFTVTVVDSTPPVLSVPAELVLPSTGGSIPADDPRVVAWLARLSATDICDSSPDLASGHPASFAPGSTTPVTFTATDGSGNVATATGYVRVLPADGDPTIDIVSPLDGACLSADSVPLAYEVTPSNTVVSVSGTLTRPDGTTRAVGPGPYTEQGDYVVTATAGAASDTVSFSIDRTRPVVVIVSPERTPRCAPYPYSQYRTTLAPASGCCEHDHEGHRHGRHDRRVCGRGADCDEDRGERDDDDDDGPGRNGRGHAYGHDKNGRGDERGRGHADCPRSCCASRVASDLPLRVSYQAHDDDGITGDLQQVELVLDGLALPSTTTALDAATFVRLGLPVLGRHTLLVRATDRAGNVGTDDVCFEVVLHADRCAGVLALSRKEERVKDKKGGEKKEKLIRVRLDLPATITGSPLDPVEADVVGASLRLEAVGTGRQAQAVDTKVEDGALVATFRQADLAGRDGLGAHFRLTGRFFTTSGPAFIAEGELKDK